MAARTNKRDVAPFLSLPSTPSLAESIEMGPIPREGTTGAKISINNPSSGDSHRSRRAAYMRPAVYGPERVVDDARVRAYHQSVLRDMLWLVFGWGLAWTALVIGVPGR
jgi:hypothetical protein